MELIKIARSRVAAWLVLLASAVSLAFLPGCSSGGSGLPSQYSLTKAVPVDAAVVMYAQSLDKAVSALGNSSSLAGLFSKIKGEESDLYSLIRGSHAVVSWHYSGKLVPLLLLKDDFHRRDSVLTRLKSFSSDLVRVESIESSKGTGIIAVSSSSELLKSCRRHFEEGMSIASKSGYEQALCSVRSDSRIIFCGEHFSRVFPALRGFSKWLTFSLDGVEDGFDLRGSVLMDGGHYASPSFAGHSNPVRFEFPSVSPSSTMYAVAVSLDGYRDSYEAHLSAQSSLPRNTQALKNLGRSLDTDLLDWYRKQSFKEAAKIVWGEGKKSRNVIMLRSSSELDETCEIPAESEAWLHLLLGSFFAPSGTANMVIGSHWIAFSDKETLERLCDLYRVEESLSSLLEKYSDSNLVPTSSALVYNALDIDSRSLFARGVDAQVRSFGQGYSYVPLFASLTGDRLDVSVRRHTQHE